MNHLSDIVLQNVIFVSKSRYNVPVTVFPPIVFNELVYYFGGKRTKTFGDTVLEEEGETLEYMPYTGKKEKYRVERTQSGDCIDIFFGSDFVLEEKAFAFSVAHNPVFRQCFEKIHALWLLKETGYEYECLSLLYRILGEAEKALRPAYLPRDKALKIAPAEEYIFAHFHEADFNCRVLPELCHIKYTYFKRLFVTKYGMPPISYVTALRMKLAKDLLRSGLYSVSETAEKAGYASPYYFSRAFKKENGISPSDYINQTKQLP
ncbi:MAG: AraC family transcriptional regulator [Clostridia bacterium]|nr:AraC family transcriptional regulator [Clostridia bacterium]